MQRDPKIILASGSPRRQELLKGLGLKFHIHPADIDESSLPQESAEALVERLSLSKARKVAQSYPEALIIAADTLVILDAKVLSKPKDLEENKIFISQLEGRSHEVYTGHALTYKEQEAFMLKRTKVRFRHLSEKEIDTYVATQEGLDKAGGYAIQGYGSALIPHIEGCYFNVVGLSVATLVELAKGLGVKLV